MRLSPSRRRLVSCLACTGGSLPNRCRTLHQFTKAKVSEGVMIQAVKPGDTVRPSPDVEVVAVSNDLDVEVICAADEVEVDKRHLKDNDTDGANQNQFQLPQKNLRHSNWPGV